ncbi:hypothetical protein GGR52DRAFT_114199 [Hypoxylon sp. FL1284]|nr:hypothetical protein GGR52DRAFT_114199 [Hypoxylon sp. FL1284]
MLLSNISSRRTPVAHIVLPSRAPSDEPSPPMTEPRKSPPITEARFVLDTSVNDQPAPSPVLAGTRSVSASRATSTSSNMVLSTPPAPTLPMLRPNAGLQEQLEQQPAKRRRVGTPWLQFLESLGAAQALRTYVISTGGDQRLEELVERPRFQLLAEACEHGDLFFVALHQLFCAWSVNQANVHRLCDEVAHPPSLVDNAFGIMGTFLKNNYKLRQAHLYWLSRFPSPLEALKANPTHEAVIKQVLDFLMCVAQKWQLAHHSHLASNYPFLVGELLDTFQLVSPLLQTIIFRASRRSLRVPDGPHAAHMEALFKSDQQKHTNVDGLFVKHPASSHYQVYNNSLTETYRKIIEQSHGLLQTGRQSASPLSALAPPQMRPPMQPRPNQVAGVQHGPVPLPSHSPVDEASRRQFPYPHSLAGTPPNAPSPAPASSNPILRMPVPSQYTVFSQGRPNTHLPSTTFLPQVSAQHHQQQQVPGRQFSPQGAQQAPGRQFSQQGAHTAPAPPQYALDHIATHHGHTYQPGQQYPQAVPNLSGQTPVASRGTSYSEGQTSNNAASVPMARPVHMLPSSELVHSMNRPQGHARPSNAQTQPNLPSRGERLIPPLGERIPLMDYPHDAQDLRSVYGSLHQAHLRSPKRMHRELDKASERHYQAVKAFPVPPVATSPRRCVYKFKFTISGTAYGNIAKDERVKGELLPVNLYRSGSLRVRIRSCYKNSDASFDRSAWVVTDTHWPEHIFMALNGTMLSVRRKTHYSKDAPVEASSFVAPGDNLLSVFIPPGGEAPAHQDPYMAVEVVEILSHSRVIQLVRTHGQEPADKTREIIKRRLTGPSNDGVEEDELAMASNLSIDLADPFTLSIFNTPVRGEKCTHLECFDLETWLNTRLGKKCGRCNNAPGCKYCAREPSFVDKWKCPLCGGDARPYSLRIDGYLSEVRSQLEKENKLRTKSILVSADGTWRPKEEPMDDSDINSDDDGSAPLPKKRSQSATVGPLREKPPIEIIELDDD